MSTRRKELRLKGYDYSQEGMYFVTMCVQDRQSLFGDIQNNEMFLNTFGKIVVDIWNGLPSRFPQIELDSYVIMPNHIHRIISINRSEVGEIHEMDRVGEIHEFPLR